LNEFDDIFHTCGDDDDEQEDENIDFYNLALQMEKQDEIQAIHISDNENDDDDNDDNTDLIVEEEQLSQKLGQLSASQERAREQEESKQTTTTMKKRPTHLEATTAVTKKIKMDTKDSTNTMPWFLLATNNSFERMITPILRRTNSSIYIEDLRQIALLIYNLAVTDLLHWQWETYLLSGTGVLKYQVALQDKENPIDGTSLWPTEVKTKIIEKGLTTARNESEIDFDTCRKCLENYLRQLNDNAEQYRTQLNDRKRRLNGFTEEMEKEIEHFLHEQSINQIKIKVQTKIAIVEYDYYDRLLELAYLRLKPNQYQVRQTFDSLLF
jgi:hypothetical protein